MNIKTSWIDLSVDGEKMRAYVAQPENAAKAPAMLVLQEALGVNAQLRGVTERYAQAGFVSIAPELFHRVKAGFEASQIVMDEIMPLINSLTSEGLVADCKAAYEWLTQQANVDAKRVSAVGFCMGGRAAFLANSELPLACSIAYYGGRIAPALLDRVKNLHGPQLFFWGGIDKGIPPEQRRAVADALREAGKLFVDVEFSDANHAFFNEQADRYNQAAAEQSWALSQAFLRSYCS